MSNTIIDRETYNATDLRFKLGQILTQLEQKQQPILIISRSQPKAWLYPYHQKSTQDFFARWEKNVLPKYKKVKAKELIDLIRKDRDERQ